MLEPRLKPMPLLAHPNLESRVRRFDGVLLRSAMHLGKPILAATMITVTSVRMQNRFSTLLTFPD